MKKILFFSVLFAIVASGCEFKSYEEHEIPAYSGALTFTEVNKKAEWKNRYGHAAVSYDNKLWVLGGYNPGEIKNDTYCEDVWSSEDGITWDQVTDNAPWHGRKGHRVVVFDDGSGDAIFLVGGFSVNEETGYRQYNNDVWKSTDGLNWTELKATSDTNRTNTVDFFPRMEHALVVANHGGIDYMYVIGGRTQYQDLAGLNSQGYFKDVWRSTDGISWEKLDNNDFGERCMHAAAVDPSTGTIYLQGGLHGLTYGDSENAHHPSDDWEWVWSSTDGVTWTSEKRDDVGGMFGRADHFMVYYKERIWTFSGRTTSTMHYGMSYAGNYTPWYMDFSSDNWIAESGSPYFGRHGYAITVHKDKIWILGGFTSNIGQDNDVWSAEL